MAETNPAEEGSSSRAPETTSRVGGSNLLLIGGAAGLIVAIILVAVSIVVALNQRSQAANGLSLPPDYVPQVGATLPTDSGLIPALPPDVELPDGFPPLPTDEQSAQLPPLALNNLPPGVSPVQLLLTNPSLILGNRLQEIAVWLSCVMSAAALTLSIITFRRTRLHRSGGEAPPPPR
ncbi:MAG: hypothetical protein IT326_01385 [Anaerolineae bacterium]|nr:hypothetical protein [Anaerolineae bacterium]